MTDVNFATADSLVNRDDDLNSRPAIRSNTFRDSFIESENEMSGASFDEFADFDDLSSNTNFNNSSIADSADSSRALSSAIVAGILSQHQSGNPEEELAQLLEDDAVSIFMQSAKTYAQHIGVSEQDAVSEILVKLSRLEELWKEVLHRKGVEQLESESNS